MVNESDIALFVEDLELHRKDGRAFDIIAHPFLPIVTVDPTTIDPAIDEPMEEIPEQGLPAQGLELRFRPMIYEIVGKDLLYVTSLDSEATSVDAIEAGLAYLKTFAIG